MNDRSIDRRLEERMDMIGSNRMEMEWNWMGLGYRTDLIWGQRLTYVNRD